MDKRQYTDALATEAQNAANKDDHGAVCNITTQLCDKKSSRNVPIKDREGVVLSSDEEKAERWVEHFKGILNRPNPTSQAVFSDDRKMLNIDTGPFTLSELDHAIQKQRETRRRGR